MVVLEEYNESDSILPLLSAKLEKDPANQDCRKYFFNAWMTKILKLSGNEGANDAQKENLEEELEDVLLAEEIEEEFGAKSEDEAGDAATPNAGDDVTDDDLQEAEETIAEDEALTKAVVEGEDIDADAAAGVNIPV